MKVVIPQPIVIAALAGNKQIQKIGRVTFPHGFIIRPEGSEFVLLPAPRTVEMIVERNQPEIAG